MNYFIRNLWRMTQQPDMLPPYLRWIGSGGQPLVDLSGGGVVGGWQNFSEYLRRRAGVPTDEQRIMAAMLATGTSPKVAIDVGGNLGLFTLTLAGLGYDHVHVFEPIPQTYDRLTANLRRNPFLATRISAHMIGASEISGTAKFFYDATSAGQASIVEDEDSETNLLTASVVRLDDFCAAQRIDRVAFLKVDVEGFELSVLKGAHGLLEAGRVQALYIEVIRDALANAGATPDDLYSYLSGLGYRPYQTCSDGTVDCPLGPGEIADRMEAHRNVLWLWSRE